MTSIADVRGAIAGAALTVTGLERCDGYILDKIVPPHGQLTTLPRDPRFVFGSTKTVYRFALTIYVQRTSEEAAQALLDGFAEPSGATSITAAIEDETNWGSVDIDYVSVVEISGIGESSVAESKYLIETFTVEVCW